MSDTLNVNTQDVQEDMDNNSPFRRENYVRPQGDFRNGKNVAKREGL